MGIQNNSSVNKCTQLRYRIHINTELLWKSSLAYACCKTRCLVSILEVLIMVCNRWDYWGFWILSIVWSKDEMGRPCSTNGGEEECV
jgi:hypothetical protein